MLSRFRLLSILLALSVVGAAGLASAATNFGVDAAGMSAFAINGVNNPSLTLTRGQTYTFTISIQAQNHPFWITTARGAGDTSSNAFNQGVTNNGASSSPTAPAVMTFTVPASAPSLLFYQCSFHDAMGGNLNIVSPAPVPSMEPVMAAALGALLLLAAYARKTWARTA